MYDKNQRIEEFISYDAANNSIEGTYIIADGSRLASASDYKTSEMCCVSEGDTWVFIAKNSTNICNLWGYSDRNRTNPIQLIDAPFNISRVEEIIISSGVRYIQGFGVKDELTSTKLSLSYKNNLEERTTKLAERTTNLENDTEILTKGVEQLRTDVDSLLIEEEEVDLFENEILDKYITPSGTIGSSAGWSISEFHKTKPGEKWLYTGKSTAGGLSTVWGYADENRNGAVAITAVGTGSWANLDIVVPNGVYFIQAQSTSDVNHSMINVIEGDTHYIYYDSSKGSFREFLRNNIVNPSKNNTFIVHVAAGTYDISEEITAEEIAGGTYIGITIPNFTTIKGCGKDKTVFTCDIASGKISTLNLAGTSSLENLTVIGNHCRYAIHDDFSVNNDGTKRVIKNCVFKSNECSYGYAYGSGCRSGQKWYFENCEFIGETYEDGGFAIHSNVNFSSPTNVKFVNCIFNSKNGHSERACDIRGLDNGNVINNLQLIGCSWNGMRLIGVSASYFDWNITGTANKINNAILIQETTTYNPLFISGASCVLTETLKSRNGDNILISNIDSTTGHYLGTDGVSHNHPNYAITDFIYIKGAGQLIYNGRIIEPQVVAAVAYYDENKQFISYQTTSVTYTTSMTLTIPITAIFAKFCCNKHTNKFFVTCDFPNIDFIKDYINYINSVLDKKTVDNSWLISFFSKTICIGDSVTQGHIYDYPKTPAQGSVILSQSYPTRLAKLTDWEIENAGISGYSALQWWDNKKTSYDYSNYELAIIELGLNGGITDNLENSTFDGSLWTINTSYSVGDKKMYNGIGYECITAHTSVDSFDASKWVYAYNDYSENNTGSYCKIIENILISNPNIIIVLVISPYWSYINRTETPNMILEIAERYGLDVIDLRNVSYLNLNDLKYHGHNSDDTYNMVHFNAIGYLAKAEVIYKNLCNVFNNNISVINQKHII